MKDLKEGELTITFVENHDKRVRPIQKLGEIVNKHEPLDTLTSLRIESKWISVRDINRTEHTPNHVRTYDNLNDVVDRLYRRFDPRHGWKRGRHTTHDHHGEKIQHRCHVYNERTHSNVHPLHVGMKTKSFDVLKSERRQSVVPVFERWYSSFEMNARTLRTSRSRTNTQ